MSELKDSNSISMPDAAAVERAIKITYAQVMLGSVFGASTGGMFLTGFAMQLGADDVLLGLMATIPALFVVFQFAGAYMVEKGFSRKRQTIIFSLATPLCWCLVMTIPFVAKDVSNMAALGVLVAIIALVTVSNQFAGSARGSWIGELIPAERRGKFFGYAAMFGGIIGAAFAIGEGKFLDAIKHYGLAAFTGLFLFGSIFGLVSGFLHMPQPDCPLPGGEARTPYFETMKRTLRNRPFVTLAIVHAVTAMSNIANPFWNAYLLRDVEMSFFGLGVLNCIGTVAAVVSAPLWGKAVSKFGCRPIVILSLLILAPASLFWMPVGKGDVAAAYMWVPWGNLLGAIGGSALGVSISTLVYKASQPEGRSVQFAMYNTFVTYVGAPMPLLGGALVSWMKMAGFAIDLRLVFILWSCSLIAAAIIARKLVEPDAVSTKVLVMDRFPSWVGARFAATVAVPMGLFEGAIDKLQKAALDNADDAVKGVKKLFRRGPDKTN